MISLPATSAAVERPSRRKLTEASIARMRAPAAGRLQIPDSVVTGLWLRLSSSGVRSWSVLYRARGDLRVRRFTIGRWPGVGVAGARELAREVLGRVAAGRDPQADKLLARAKQSDLVEHVVAEHIELHVKRRRPRSWQRHAALLERKLGPWHGRRIAAITTADIHRLLDGEVAAGHGRTANLTLAAVRRLMRWATSRKYRGDDPTAGIEQPTAERSRERVLSDAELAAIWRAAGALSGSWPSYVRMLILTAQRRSEVGDMAWIEVDFSTSVWSIPGSRSKTKKDHTVPLAGPALAILGAVREGAQRDLVFSPSGRRLTGYAQLKNRLDKLSGVEDWRLHDIRRTVTSGMAGLGVEPHVLSRVLGHAETGTSKITSIYNRHHYLPQQRAAVELWASHVLALTGEGEKKVVSLRGACT